MKKQFIKRAHHRGACATYQMQIDLGEMTVEQALTMLSIQKQLDKDARITTMQNEDELIEEIERLEGTNTQGQTYRLFQDRSQFDAEAGDEVIGIIHNPKRLGPEASMDFSFLEEHEKGKEPVLHGESIVFVKDGKTGLVKTIAQTGYQTARGTGEATFNSGKEVMERVIKPYLTDCRNMSIYHNAVEAAKKEIGKEPTIQASRRDDGGIKIRLVFQDEAVKKMGKNLVKGN